MNYVYTIQKILPKSEYMRVAYSSEGNEDYIKSFNPTQFDEDTLKAIIEGFAPHVVEYWERIGQHPEEFSTFSGSSEADAPVIQEVDPNYAPELEPVPEYDHWSQRVEAEQVVDPMQKTVGWTVIDLTEEETEEYLQFWRSQVSITMRQCRLALLREGVLEQVQVAIDNLPEPEKSAANIEWQYAHMVSRQSPFVDTLGTVIGFQPKELDELFIAASGL